MSKSVRQQKMGKFDRLQSENFTSLSPFNPNIGPSRSVPPPVVILRQTRLLDIRITRNSDDRQARL